VNVQGIVLWGVLMGASFAFVNGMGLFSVALANPNAPGAAAIQQSANCVSVSSAGICTQYSSDVGAPNSILSPIYTFGYFLWSFVQAIPIMAAGILVPGSIANIFFGSGIGVVVNAGVFLLFAFWAWYMVGNRPNEPE
jgi:hypothetical protein